MFGHHFAKTKNPEFWKTDVRRFGIKSNLRNVELMRNKYHCDELLSTEILYARHLSSWFLNQVPVIPRKKNWIGILNVDWSPIIPKSESEIYLCHHVEIPVLKCMNSNTRMSGWHWPCSLFCVRSSLSSQLGTSYRSWW